MIQDQCKNLREKSKKQREIYQASIRSKSQLKILLTELILMKQSQEQDLKSYAMIYSRRL